MRERIERDCVVCVSIRLTVDVIEKTIWQNGPPKSAFAANMVHDTEHLSERL